MYKNDPLSSLRSTYPQMRVLTNMYDKIENEKHLLTKKMILYIPSSVIMLIISLFVLDVRTAIEFAAVLFLELYIYYKMLILLNLSEEFKYIKSRDHVVNGINISVVDSLTKELFKKEGYVIIYNILYKLVQALKIFITIVGIFLRVLS